MRKCLLFLAAVLLLTLNVEAEPTIDNQPNDIDGVYQINSWQDLLWISQNHEHWDKDYVQTDDIDFGDADTPIGEWNDSKGWSPIGKFEARNEKPFTGTYNGGGNTIENLYINRGDEELVGLFGNVSGGAEISNIRLVEVDITGEAGVGGITGGVEADGTKNDAQNTQIINCSVSGSIKGEFAVGGIAGAMFDGEINASYNEAKIEFVEGEMGQEGVVGGVVGWLLSGSVNNSYTLGDITGPFAVGGLIGVGGGVKDESQNVVIKNSFSAGSITVIDAGEKSDPDPVKEDLNPRIFENNFGKQFSNTREQIKRSAAGGVIGILYDEFGTITNCFFDKEVASLEAPSDEGVDGITGKNTEDMMDPDTYEDWGGDIVEDETVEKGYPFLAWQDTGSRGQVWIIGTGTGDPVAVPLSNTALYLSLALIAGFVFFRIHHIR